MAADNSQADGEDEQAIPESVLQSIKKSLSDQASRQRDFQLLIRVDGNPNDGLRQQFQSDLRDFIKGKMEADGVTRIEAGIALWDELNEIESSFRRDLQADLMSTNETGGSESTGERVQEQPAESEAAPTEPEANSESTDDPAFH